MRKESRIIITDLTKIKMITREYYEQHYANKLTGEIDKLLEKYTHQKLT